MKTLVVICKKTGRVICIFCCNGKKHDFRLFKESQIRMLERIQVKVDTGFLGIEKFHKNSQLPKKSSKKRPLTKEDKQFNRRISSERVMNEHVIGSSNVSRFCLNDIGIAENALAYALICSLVFATMTGQFNFARSLMYYGDETYMMF